MSDEEDDYMSDAFLAKLDNVKPSLLNNTVAAKRQMEIEKRQREEKMRRHRPIHVVQKEKLKEGLGKAISSDNKGFAMLSKMGFKPGTSLGKSADSSAIKVPISININSDGRSGLGTQTARKEVQERQLSNLKRKLQAADMSTEDYRKQMKEATDRKQVVWDLHKLQKTCRILDLEHSVQFPIHPFFWPKDFSKQEEVDDEEEEEETSESELPDSEKLEMLRKFLRNSYFYCEFCGHQYDSAQEMLTTCPGPLKDDH